MDESDAAIVLGRRGKRTLIPVMLSLHEGGREMGLIYVMTSKTL